MVRSKNIYKSITFIVFILMIIVNVLAETLPINNVTTAQVSSLFTTLITPAGYAFSIWILIYILLGLFVIYQFKVTENTALNVIQFNELRYYFCVSSLGNILWLFAWHYVMINVSIIIMILIFYCLISIIKLLKTINVTKSDKIFLSLPFELYFGWILMAMIINIAVFLVSINWSGFGFTNEFWAITILFVGTIITILTILRFKVKFFGIAVIWAYIGILINHILSTGFNKEYPDIIITLVICIIITSIFEIIALVKFK